MIKVHTKRFARSWLYVAAAGLVVALPFGYHTYETQLGAQAPAGQQADAFGSLFPSPRSQHGFCKTRS